MLYWIKQKCFVNLEKETQKNNLLVFVVIVTYTMAEGNVLQNNAFTSMEHLLFLASSLLIILLGLFIIRIPYLSGIYKYIMMTLLMMHTIMQICIFNHLPEVYQTVYFNIALSLIYLDGYLILFVGMISLVFTLLIRVFGGDLFVPFLRLETVNIPLGILFETTVVLWAITKIGGSYALILKNKNEIKKLLDENNIQLNIIKNQKKVLEEYTSQVESLVQREERNRIAQQLQHTLGQSLASIIFEIESITYLFDKKDAKKIKQAADFMTVAIQTFQTNLSQVFTDQKSLNVIEAIKSMVNRFAESAGMNINLHIMNKEEEIYRPYFYVILRGIQESLINANFGAATEASITIHFQPDNITIQISDNGMGKEVSERYGSVFSDIESRVNDLHGRFQISYFPGKGSIVTLELPQKTNRNDDIKVLIVDSEPFVRQGIEMFLNSEEDMTVINLFGSGEDAVSYCRCNQPPDIVIIDVSLHELDGVETTRIIKELYPHVRVLVLTHEHHVASVAAALEAGADAYLLKSTSPQNLVMSIRFLCSGGRLISKETYSLLANHILKSENLKRLERKIVYQEMVNHYGLKDKELQILKMLAGGLKYREIAANLFLTEGTIRNYISSIYAKLNVQHKKQAIEKAEKLGIMMEVNEKTS
ncbi:DUF4077 domain-containing protein [Brevibacillus migulae]|uniref:DUF4077 domain-containing protein n=1 Tax=Brevibacillus migulae TaxID=1644114 RepID=UPI0014318259|nr:DUF4077 domain-containing protein [Brevibacillus migulae]